MDHSLTLPNAGDSAHAAPPMQPLALSLPSVDEPLRYAWAYWSAALSSLLGAHRLRPERLRPYSAAAPISARQAHRWHAVFDVPARARAFVPLLTNQGVGTLLQARLFADLGVNQRHLHHLRHHTTLHAGVAACARARDQRLTCAVPRVLRLGQDRALVEVQTRVLAADGQLLSQVEDGFAVTGLPQGDLSALPSDRGLLRELLGARRRLPRLTSSEGLALVSEMHVPHDMGWVYGRVSGDMNPVHTCHLGAWLFGLKRPFLQGLALRNLVVRHLAELRRPIEQLSLTFVSPAHLGQCLLLLVSGSALEVHDAKGRLVAFGSSGARA